MLDLQTTLAATKSFTVPMSKLRVKSRKELSVDGRSVFISDTAFKDLLRLVGLSNKTVTHINEELHRDAGYLLIKELMTAMSNRKGMNVSLIISEEDREVKRICLEGQTGGAGSAISPAAIQELINQALDKSGKVKLSNTFISDGGTKVSFNLKWDTPITLPMRGEDISLGKQITWDMLGPTSVSNLVERLICSNGMTAVVPGKAMFLDSHTDPSVWYKELFKDIINPNKELITHYEKRVLEAMQTNLSVYEYNTIKGHLINNWSADGARITRYLGDESWKSEYAARGIDLTKATAGQLKNCPTPVNSWDAINCLTDMASHRYTTQVPDLVCRQTQKMAGRLLNKTWDENQQIFNIPVFDRTTPQSSFSAN